jgi:hypothetical protein
MPFYAHSNGPDKGRWQRLNDHLANTARLAREFGANTGIADFAATAAWLQTMR